MQMCLHDRMLYANVSRSKKLVDGADSVKAFGFDSVQELGFDALEAVWNLGFELVRNAEFENAFDVFSTRNGRFP